LKPICTKDVPIPYCIGSLGITVPECSGQLADFYCY